MRLGWNYKRVTMNYKRKKSKRSVRCTLCTPHKWMGNHAGRYDFKTGRSREAADEQIRAADEVREIDCP